MSKSNRQTCSSWQQRPHGCWSRQRPCTPTPLLQTSRAACPPVLPLDVPFLAHGAACCCSRLRSFLGGGPCCSLAAAGHCCTACTCCTGLWHTDGHLPHAQHLLHAVLLVHQLPSSSTLGAIPVALRHGFEGRRAAVGVHAGAAGFAAQQQLPVAVAAADLTVGVIVVICWLWRDVQEAAGWRQSKAGQEYIRG